MSDPIRLVDDPEAPELLRELVRQAHEELPSMESAERVYRRLEGEQLAPAGGESLGSGTVTTLKIGGLVLGLAVGGIALGSRSSSPPEDRHSPAVEEIPRQAAKASLSMEEPTVSDRVGQLSQPRAVERGALHSPPRAAETQASADSRPAASETSRRSRSRPRTPTDESAGVQTPKDRVAEAELLLRAKRAMPADPRHALTLADRHARQFPAGVLAEERELIAIRALVTLEQTSDAQRRVREFERTYPSSPHLAAARRALESTK